MQKHKLALTISASTIAALIVATCVTVMVCSAKDAFHFTSYAFDSQSNVNVTDYDTNIIKVDGNLNDKVWQNKKWLTCSTKDNNNPATVSFTMTMGSKGVYIAAKVQDTGVWYGKERGASYNTGVEMYLAPYGTLQMERQAYQITMDAGNDYGICRYTNGNYFFDSRKMLLATHVDGTLNSSSCKGYELEGFIPYSQIGLDSPADKFNIDVALIRTSTNESSTGADNQNERMWTNMGTLYHTDYSWTCPKSWYTFTASGLVEDNVTLQASGGGQLENVTKQNIPGDSFTVRAKSVSGKVLDSLKVNGQDMTWKLAPDSQGATYTLAESSGDLMFDANYIDLPSTTSTVSGKLKVPTGMRVTDATVYLQKGTFVQSMTPDENGNFMAQVPAMDGVYLVAKLNGCDTQIQKLDLSHGSESGIGLTLNSASFGQTQDFNPSGSYNMDYYISRNEADAISNDNTTNEAYTFLTRNENASQVVSADLSFPFTGARDLRQGFALYQKQNGVMHSAFICLTWWGSEDGSTHDAMVVQVIGNDGSQTSWNGVTLDANFPDLSKKLKSGQSVRFTVANKQGQVGVFVDGVLVYTIDETSLLSQSQPTTVALESWIMKPVYQNLSVEFGADAVDAVYNASCPFVDETGFDVSKSGTLSGQILTVNGPSKSANIAYYYRTMSNFSFETTFKFLSNNDDSRQGVMIRFPNPDGTYKFVQVDLVTGKNENTSQATCQLYGFDGNNASNIFKDQWSGTPLTDAQRNLYLGSGIKMKLIRQGGAIYVALNGQIVSTIKIPNFSDTPATVGIDSTINGASYQYSINQATGFTVRLQQSANGAIGIDRTQYQYGNALSIHVAPNAGCKLSSILVDGVERIGQYSHGVVSIPDYGGSSVAVIKPTFTKIHYASVKFAVKKNILNSPQPADGATVAFTYADGTKTSGRVKGASCTLALEQGVTGTLTISLPGYETISQTITVAPATLSYTLQAATLINDVNMDLSRQGSGIVQPATAQSFSSAHFSALSDKTQYVISGVFKQQDLTSTSPSRQGFICGLGDKSVGFTFVRSPVWMLTSVGDLAGWTMWYNIQLDAAKLNEFSTSGLKLTIVRNGGTFYIYLDDTLVNTFSAPTDYANKTGQVDIATYDNIMGPINFSLPLTTLPQLQVNRNMSGNGILSFDKGGYAFGDDVAITARPQTGYYLQSLTVNGKDVTGQCASNNYQYKIANCKDLVLNVNAIFAACDSVQIAVNTAWNNTVSPSNAATVTFIGNNGITYTADSTGGGLYQMYAPPGNGTLVVSQNGYDTISKTVGLTGNGTLPTVELQKSVLTNSIDMDLSEQGHNYITPLPNRKGNYADFTELSNRTQYVVSTTFTDPTLSGDRQGLIFDLDNLQFSCTILADTAGGDFVLRGLGDLTGWYNQYDISGNNPQLVQKLKSTGLTLTVVRDGKVFDCYLDGSLVYTYTAPDNLAQAVGAVRVIACSGITQPIYFSEPSTTLPAMNVTQNITGSGTIAFDQSSYTYGENVGIKFNPADGYYVSQVIVNGVDVTSQLGNGNTFTLSKSGYSYAGTGACNVEVDVTYAKYVTITIPVNTATNGTIAGTSGATVTFVTSGGQTVYADGSGNIYMLRLRQDQLNGTLTISQTGYDTIRQAKEFSTDQQIAYELQYSIMSNTPGFTGMDLSQQGHNVITPTGSYCGSFYNGLQGETNFSVSAAFKDPAKSGVRQGFTIAVGSQQLSFTMVGGIWAGNPYCIIQSAGDVNGWNTWYDILNDKAMYDAYTTTGITLTVTRSGATYTCYVSYGQVVNQQIGTYTFASDGAANADCQVGVKAWDGISEPITVYAPVF